jgi:hypothetical protein
MKMDRATAVRKLGKIIGKGFGYRINDKAPTKEEREAAKAELPIVVGEADKLKEQMNNRREAVLAADTEYQNLKAVWKATNEQRQQIARKVYGHKITVGKSVGLAGFPMFSVEAEGDSWEEILAKLSAKEKV